MTGSGEELAATIHGRLVAEASDEAPPPDLAAVSKFIARGQARWPQIGPPAAARLVSCLQTSSAAAAGRLDEADAGELWLAAACADGDSTALTSFDRDYLAKLHAPLRSMGLDGHAVEELQQRVRQRLLTAEPGEPPRVFEYAGGGRLFGLVKVVAIRMALDDLRREQHGPVRSSADERTVQCLMDGQLGPELAVIESEHTGAIKAAFQAAVDDLEPSERAVLRLHLLEGSSIDEIAALHDVHRATAARRIVRIRTRLAEGTRDALRQRLALEDSRLESLLRAVDSRLDLSLSRLLAPDSADGPSEGS